ncbi:MAG: hydroxyisourate hydrolase [Planctomycetota bacterium]|nr:MAG: hydroxyisourate hydrolase [Planctomycetota bacterium]
MNISISTHVLDTSIGRPAGGLEFELARQNAEGNWDVLVERATDDDGRAGDLRADAQPPGGVFRLTFATGAYFKRMGVDTFYPQVSVEFRASPDEHYHVPLLVSPFGYSTYRGS